MTSQGFHNHIWQQLSLNCLPETSRLLWIHWGALTNQWCPFYEDHCKIFNISNTLVGNEIVDHSDVVGASPAGAAPTTSSFLTPHLVSIDRVKTTARRNEKYLSFWSATCIRDLMVGICLLALLNLTTTDSLITGCHYTSLNYVIMLLLHIGCWYYMLCAWVNHS